MKKNMHPTVAGVWFFGVLGSGCMIRLFCIFRHVCTGMLCICVCTSVYKCEHASVCECTQARVCWHLDMSCFEGGFIHGCWHLNVLCASVGI
jgi:hypothetical protein